MTLGEFHKKNLFKLNFQLAHVNCFIRRAAADDWLLGMEIN